MNPARKIAQFLAVFFLGLSIVFATIIATRLNGFEHQKFGVEAGKYAVSVYKDEPNHELFRTSPLDDYLYRRSEKSHILNNDTWLESKNKTDDFVNLIKAFVFKQKDVIWEVKDKNDGKFTYVLTDGPNNSIKLVRKFDIKGIPPSHIGQSLVICQTCFVVDDKNRILFEQNLITPEKIGLATTLKLTPIVIVNMIVPTDSKSLYIYDINFNKQFQININPEEQVLYDEQWHIIEVKKPFENNQEIEQEIILNI